VSTVIPKMLAQITALLGILHSSQASMDFINCWADKQVTEGRCFLLFIKARWAPNSGNGIRLGTKNYVHIYSNTLCGVVRNTAC